jgi:hypothetical protein
METAGENSNQTKEDGLPEVKAVSPEVVKDSID